MEDTGISLLTVIFIAAVLVATVLVMRKVADRNTVVARPREALAWQDFKCPGCAEQMAQGMAMAARGLTWKEGGTVKPGLFGNFGSVLENTLSFSLPPAWNMAWRCEACGLVVLDHSRLIKIAKS